MVVYDKISLLKDDIKTFIQEAEGSGKYPAEAVPHQVKGIKRHRLTIFIENNGAVLISSYFY